MAVSIHISAPKKYRSRLNAGSAQANRPYIASSYPRLAELISAKLWVSRAYFIIALYRWLGCFPGEENARRQEYRRPRNPLILGL
jgi:hypothetical protein